MMINKTYLIIKKTSLFDILYNDLQRMNDIKLYPVRNILDNKKAFYIDIINNNLADKIIKNNCLNVKEKSYKSYTAEI